MKSLLVLFIKRAVKSTLRLHCAIFALNSLALLSFAYFCYSTLMLKLPSEPFAGRLRE